MSSDRYRPDYDFEPGELMPWQEMSKLVRQLAETCSELASIIGAEYSDIKTRLDDLEEQMGKISPNWLCSEDEARKHDELDDYPEVYSSVEEALDAHRTIDQWLI